MADIPEDDLIGCDCRWHGDNYVRRCALHDAWHAAIHDWAERAKEAEALLKTREALDKVAKAAGGAKP